MRTLVRGSHIWKEDLLRAPWAIYKGAQCVGDLEVDSHHQLGVLRFWRAPTVHYETHHMRYPAIQGNI